MNNFDNRAAWRTILMTSVSAAALSMGATAALGQETPPPATPPASEEAPADKPVEKVTVTGTRLKKNEFTSPSPVQIVDPEKAEKRGSIDTATTIQSSSVAKGSAQITSAVSSAFVTNGGPGTQTISLRGLGAERTLVLLNGRRAGPAGVRGAVGPFDLNVIPQSMIESVEILKDGASSVYGSDAVAGVVNIITKRDTDGIEGAAFYGAPFEGGGEEERYNALWGMTFDGGHIQASVDYYKRHELKIGDRDYLDCAEDNVYSLGGARIDRIDPRTGRSACRDLLWGHIWLYDYAYYYTPNQSPLADPTDPRALFPVDPFDPPRQLIQRMQYNYAGDNLQNYIPPLAPTGGDPFLFSAPPGWFPVGYDGPSYAVENATHPFVRDATFVPETERFTVFVDGAYQITDAVEVFAEFIYNRRETYQNGVRQFWQFGFTENFVPGFGDPFAPGFNGSVLISPTPLTDWFDSGQKVDYYRGMAGLKGDFGGFLAGWSWDFYSQYSRSDGDYYQQVILQEAIDTQDFRTSSCVGTNLPISGRPCIDINWTDPEFLRGNFTPEQRAFLFDEETGNTKYTQMSAEASITGTLFEIWAGPVDVAFGAAWRNDEINDVPGEITLANNSWGLSGAGITAGEATTTEYFAEGDIPLLTDVPFAKSFNVRLSGRYTEVDTVGDGDETYKIGANWQVNDWLRFRGTYGTSFRAPQLFELFLADQTSFLSQRAIDPCIQWGAKLANDTISQQFADNCAADGVPPGYLGGAITATIVTGGGLGVLKPETSVAKSVSVVLTPNEFLPEGTRLSVAVDYFEIEVAGEIAQLGAANIVAGCYGSDFFPTDPLCAQFTRGTPTDPFTIDEVRDSFININNQTNRGVDVTVEARQELPDAWGDLRFLSQMTWQFEDTVALFEGTEVSNNGEDGEPMWVGDFTLEWTKGEWSVFWSVEAIQHTSDIQDFIDANRETCTPVPTVDDPNPVNPIFGQRVCRDLVAESRMYHAASVTKEFGDNMRITLGVANLFDEVPPTVSGNNLAEITTVGRAPFTSNYDYYGRRAFISVTKKF
jgi:iron complex outermembrane recepter protein